MKTETEHEPETATAVDSTDLVDHAAKVAWDAYKEAVGGKTYNGDPMPTWEELCKDETKARIVKAWEIAGRAVWKLAKLDNTHEIIKSGHAGCLPDTGMIVDCRIHPEAIPYKQ